MYSPSQVSIAYDGILDPKMFLTLSKLLILYLFIFSNLLKKQPKNKNKKQKNTMVSRRPWWTIKNQGCGIHILSYFVCVFVFFTTISFFGSWLVSLHITIMDMEQWDLFVYNLWKLFTLLKISDWSYMSKFSTIFTLFIVLSKKNWHSKLQKYFLGFFPSPTNLVCDLIICPWSFFFSKIFKFWFFITN